MKIIGGEKRGAHLAQLSQHTTRPTAQRTREAIFNLLMGGRFGHQLLHKQMTVLDLCAGTGALALEALSRGAGHAVLVEGDKQACQVITQNSKKLGYTSRTTLICADVTQPHHHRPAPASVLFCDPPYDSGFAQIAVTRAIEQSWVEPQALIIIETRKNETAKLGADCVFLESRTYGMARISLFRAS